MRDELRGRGGQRAAVHWLLALAVLGAVLVGVVCLLVGSAVRAGAQQVTLLGDAHVSSVRTTVNAGSLSNLNVGGEYTALLQFDLSALPPGTTAAQITRATLRVYCNRADVPGVVSAVVVGSAWSEAGVTYATLPSLGATVQTAQVAGAGAYVTFDVTAAVQGWVSGTTPNFGLALTAAGGAQVQFDSKENDQTGHAPEMNIALAAGGAGSVGPAGATGATGATGDPGPQGVPGPMGPQGFPGVNGAPGATGATGAVGPAGPAGSGSGGGGIQYQGTYGSTTNYGLGDVVTWSGSSWVSLMASNGGNTPGVNPAAWGLLASVGAEGAMGATGATGAVGQQGPQGFGIQGATGATGAAGATGAVGPAGLVYQGAYASTKNYALGDVVVFQGSSYASLTGFNVGQTPGLSPEYWGMLTEQGPIGITGAMGLPGPTGVAGPLGPVGPPGEKGDAGAQGVAGQAGAQGIPGTTGAQGLSGPMGPQGVQGPVGMDYVGAYSSTTNYGPGDGVTWQGAGWVSIAANNHGNTPSLSPAEWSMFAAGGPAGAVGATGPAGTPGVNGLNGATGPDGATGATGATGSAGSPGLVYRNGYDATTNYALGDVVVWQGASWVSLLGFNVGQVPDLSPGYWGVLTSVGPQGVMGSVGPTGPIGLQGQPGVVGPAGPTGLAGPMGIQGPAGTQGLTGATGAVGSAGPQGLQGSPGQAGAQGVAGATGATGLQGPLGPQGLVGPVGMSFQGAYNSFTNYAVGDGVTWLGSGWVSIVAGNRGNAPSLSPAAWQQFSAPGAMGAQGVAGPQGATGVAGANGAPGVMGPSGATGAQGQQGVVGPAGPTGVAGPMGIQGPAGAQGLTGATGAVGATGAQGLQGAAGQAGAQGIQGVAGVMGAQGPAGVAGEQGIAGATGAAGPAGAVGMNFRGAWNQATHYAVNDAATFAGSTYLALVQGNNAEPDVNPQDWAVVAQAGGTGATGAAGAAATVAVGTVTTLAPGARVTVTNSGTAEAAVLNFGIPQGAQGPPGTGGSSGGGSGSFAAMYHAVSFNTLYYALNSPNASVSEASGAVLAWVPLGCTVSRLDVYSQQTGAITVTLRSGAAGALTDTALACSPATNGSCSAVGTVVVAAGEFLDVRIDLASGTAAGVWTSVQCQ